MSFALAYFPQRAGRASPCVRSYMPRFHRDDVWPEEIDGTVWVFLTCEAAWQEHARRQSMSDCPENWNRSFFEVVELTPEQEASIVAEMLRGG